MERLIGEALLTGDIQKGDVIRKELIVKEDSRIQAIEYIAAFSGDSFAGVLEFENVKHVLLETGPWVPLDVTFIAWVDYDHNVNVAFRDGHPKNYVWSHNGSRYDEDVFRAKVEKGRSSKITYLEVKAVIND